ncbi:hypothetical protein J2128_002041 [Methanomicrobium sp. W14]|nr:hypothetical protein [Methanomicrobium sp. W14]
MEIMPGSFIFWFLKPFSAIKACMPVPSCAKALSTFLSTYSPAGAPRILSERVEFSAVIPISPPFYA